MTSHGRCAVLSQRIAWFLASLIVGSGSGAPVPAQRPPNLLGRIAGDLYYHPSGVFKVQTSTGDDIEDSQATVTFNYSFLGAKTGWSEVGFVKPQLTSGRTPEQVVEALVAEFGSTVYKNKNRQIRPSVVFTERRSALGRQSTYARICFPQYPGTGITTFSDGRVVDADFIGHFELVPIEDLFLRQRQGPLSYLVVSTMQGLQFARGEDEGAAGHQAFIRRVELLVRGDWIVFSSTREGNYDLFRMQSDGSRQWRITDDTASDVRPAWSPDGIRLAFVTERHGAPDIYTIRGDGSEPARLTDHAAPDDYPAWSPDGQTIAFASLRDGAPAIHFMQVDSSGAVRLQTGTIPGVFPAWSPDGKRIALVSDHEGSPNIYVTDLDGSHMTRLTHDSAGAAFPAWSPDGSHIVYASSRDGNDEIFVIGADGSNPTRLTNHPATDMMPAWSPDGSKIAFHTDRDGNWEIYVMSSDGTSLKNLSNHPATDVEPEWRRGR